MLYDIDFAVAGLIFLIILHIYVSKQYNKEMLTIVRFKRIIVCLIVAVSADIITAITISYAFSVPIFVNYILNVLFFVSEVVCIALFPQYVLEILPPERRKNEIIDKVNTLILVAYLVICISTPFTHAIFYFDEERRYVHGYIYPIIFILPLYFLTYSFVRLMLNRSYFNKRQFFSIIGFIIFALLGPFLQMTLSGNKIIDFYALSIAAFIIVMGLETPDFIKLEKTLAELEESEKKLKEAVVRAETADKAKSDFLANMSHEIRTPINAILGMNEIIERESTEEVIRSYSANVSDAGHALLSLINDVLDFSKIEAGRMELVPATYKTSVLLREIYNIINIRCDAKCLSFNIRNNPLLPNTLYGDEARIRQILINILNNAVKYTDVGSISLNMDYEVTDDKHITLIVDVTDTGMGIKEEDIPKLFDSFQRLDALKNKDREGTGLGLSITKAFVDMMGGTISVKSIYGRGSTFTVKIPQTVEGSDCMGTFEPTAFQSNSEQYKPSFTAPNAKILVVDDVVINLKVIKGLLKQTEITVDTASSGLECLKAIATTRYDLILLDHMMPDMDGIETLEKIKQNKLHTNQDTPIIMLTANALSGAREQYMKLGFQDYISKPVRSADLEATLKKYLER